MKFFSLQSGPYVQPWELSRAHHISIMKSGKRKKYVPKAWTKNQSKGGMKRTCGGERSMLHLFLKIPLPIIFSGKRGHHLFDWPQQGFYANLAKWVDACFAVWISKAPIKHTGCLGFMPVNNTVFLRFPVSGVISYPLQQNLRILEGMTLCICRRPGASWSSSNQEALPLGTFTMQSLIRYAS